MVLATMADSSEREELEDLIEEWNATRLDMFIISKPDANLEFSGNMRFYFQEPGSKDTKVQTKVLRVSSSDTTDEVMKVLVSKFHPDMKMLTMPNYSLYEVHETGAEAHKLEMDQRPLYVQLYWQREDRDGRFLLKSEDDKMTQKLFGEEESARNPDKRKSKLRQSKMMKGKNKKKTDEKPTKNIATELYGAKPASSFTRSKSNPEAVMKRQRQKKLEDRLQKMQNPETSDGGGGPLRIFAESLQPENPYKTILCASNDTTETVLKDALQKYEVPPEEMDQYCLTMVTIAPGNHSDPESSSGIKERVVHGKDCPAAIAASWPESAGELRFYLKKKQNMPKRKQQPRKRQDEPPRRTGDRPAAASEHSPPPVKETTFDVIDQSPTEKEPGSPAVHVVDAARDLPATLEFRESGEDAFFAVVVSEVNGSAVNFKLAPTFTLYMCCRYRLSQKFHPDFPQSKRREKVTATANKVANMMWQTVKENNGMAGHLAFWMANSSEFLHFLKQDKDLSSMTEESQKILAHTTQQAFRSLVQCIKAELQNCLPAFLDPSEETDLDEHGENSIDEKFDPLDGYQSTERSFKVRHYGPHGQPLGGDQWMGKRKKSSRPVVGDVLYTLKAAMSLLRRCRVNPALTIQLFSQVFHFINMWLFNRIVLETQLRLCTRSWGVRLRERLQRLQVWAESQGLELAAECHLARVSQAALLLQLPKQDSTAISSHCYKLNSLQLRQLLELYQPERDEPAISHELIEKAVSVAESTADEIARSEGQKVLLEEEPELHLPFLLPDDGYSSEKICGVPPGLKEFLDPLITPGLCRLTIQPKASGQWTVHFKVPVGLESPPPEVIKISINKGTKGMGVSIVAAKGATQEHYGIYVKEVIDGGPAAQDGRLNTGDQILDVNGESLVGIQQEDAVKILIKAGSVVNMTVAKKAVYKHGLVELLSNVAPVQKPVESPSRAPENRNLSPLPQKKETPRPPPRYRPHHDSPQRSPPLNASVQSEVDEKQVKPEQKQVKPEPLKRQSAYERNSFETSEQPRVQSRTVVEYKLDEPPSGRKQVGVKVGVPLPYVNPADIQRRQKEIQRKAEEQEKENLEREKIAREQERLKKLQEEREEAERLERIKREEQARQEREKIEREQQERQRIERERQERERIEREKQERERVEREKQERERKEKEQQDRQRREKEEQERLRREEAERIRREEWEKRERERIEREELERQRQELERQRQEEWKKQEQERLEREQREKEEHEKRMRQDNAGLDEMTRRERELEMMLEQKRREKAERLKELERQIQQEREESERMEKELMERLMKNREERKESQKTGRPSVGGSTQVHYVNDKDQEKKSEIVRHDEIRPNRPVRAPTPAEENRNNLPMEYARRPPLPNENTRGNFVGPANEIRKEDAGLNRPIEFNRRVLATTNESRGTPPLPRKPQIPPEGNRGNYSPGKRPTLQNSKDDSFDMDPAEVERQFQQRLAEEASGKSEVDGGTVRVVRVPVQKNWESREREVEDRPRARVDWQREEEEKHRKEQQWRREQDELLVREFQQNENFRQQPAGAVAEPIHPHQGEWERDDELRRQQQEDDRLREARANQLRNRIIERPEDDEDMPGASNRTRRVKFASVRTEIIQPSPDAELAKAGVVFVHDGKVEDSDDEEFPRPPPPIDQEDAPLHPPPPQNQPDYYRRPPPPPKPQTLISNGSGDPPGNVNPPHYRDNEHAARARARLSDDGYATYPGPSRQQHNNNYPVPKPRGSASTEFSPDNAKLPFKDKMKVFNETTPPRRQMASKWEQRWVNGDSL